MNGAEYIAEFLRQRGTQKVFLMVGGACAFIVDAIAANKGLDYVCMQHEQAASMAADAVWRVNRTVGVSVCTSGPGATNALTGIACSYFDSIPSLHITGQVNKTESAEYLGAKVRQAGFQETDIVAMAKPITKYAVQVNTIEELKRELTRAYNLAITGRMGPVLIDVPMNVQKDEAGDVVEYTPPERATMTDKAFQETKEKLTRFFAKSARPAVLFGAGVGLSGVEREVIEWLEREKLPFVASWNALGYFNHDTANYCGQIGVYGNLGANYIMQNADALLVLGSRLDNRQRSGNAKSFAPSAHVLVVDIDEEELKKYKSDGYETAVLDLRFLPEVVKDIPVPARQDAWKKQVGDARTMYFGKNISNFAPKNATLSPYEVIEKLNGLIDDDAIVVADTGANLCWIMQMFHRTHQTLFTDGGMSAMGYSLPAAIGAAMHAQDKQVVCLIGDGGLQVNIQELQSVRYYGLPIKIVLFNNQGYGIIKQFQDANFKGRYEASGRGYGVPDFSKIAEGYGVAYHAVRNIADLTPSLFSSDHAVLIEVMVHENTPVEPKLDREHVTNGKYQ